MWRRRIATPAGDYDGTLTAIAGLVQTAERELSRQGTVGIGTPSAISPDTGMIKNSNSTVLIGRGASTATSAGWGRPIRIENDANCFALSEAPTAPAPASRVFGVIFGTGLRRRHRRRRDVLAGPHRIAGEWGHNPLPWPAPNECPASQC